MGAATLTRCSFSYSRYTNSIKYIGKDCTFNLELREYKCIHYFCGETFGKPKQEWEGNIRLNIRRKNYAGVVLKGNE
jgi:hypothetical protein